MIDNTTLGIFIALRHLDSIHKTKDLTYLVGGCVRDYCLGLKPKDFDFVTQVPLEIVKNYFLENGWKCDTVGECFLVLFIAKDGKTVEIANYRKDIPSIDGRHPNGVEIGTMQEDAKRRDFTINALYWNPIQDIVLDPTKQGESDLNAKLLRFIGNPDDRIKDDYLRVFRAFRFCSTKGLTMEKKTLTAVRRNFNIAYNKTNPERVRLELERMV